MLAGTYMRTVQIRHRTFRAAQTVPQFPLRIAIVAVLTIVASCVSRPAVQPQVMEVLDADTPKTTVEGNAFTAPAGWDSRSVDRQRYFNLPKATRISRLLTSTQRMLMPPWRQLGPLMTPTRNGRSRSRPIRRTRLVGRTSASMST